MSNDTILRKVKSQNFTVVDNGYLDNNKLSLKAKGLMTYLLRLPDDWHFNKAHLVKQSTDGEESLESGLKELEAAGHLTRKPQGKDSKGKFVRAEWVIYEIPQIQKMLPQPGFPATGDPVPGNPPLPNTNRPSTEDTNMFCSVLGEDKLSDSVKKKTPKGDPIEILKPDIFSRALREGKDWSIPELNRAWQALVDCPGPVSDGFKFFEGTISNFREAERKQQRKQKGEYKPCNMKKPPAPAPSRGRSLEKSSKGNLYDFLIQMGV